MLQRIQSVFLVFAAAAMLVASVTPLLIFQYDAFPAVLKAAGVYVGGQVNDATWPLLGVGIVSAVLSLFTVFLYGNRKLQIRLSVFTCILMVGFYLYVGGIVYMLYAADSFFFGKIGIGIAMPLIAIVFTVLAIGRIKADEALVKSLNRLRR